ncbi:hypothetical protein AAJCM20276_21710 [Acetobacter aceti]|uniref:Uncharacterized protein n=1 Tax=Acetobacter aceti TaxID=435 RepID=A0A6S6PF33_ACEAC|nr:hypothetical protein AAJCM20276_21710 [Acetobacter aceti]
MNPLWQKLQKEKAEACGSDPRRHEGGLNQDAGSGRGFVYLETVNFFSAADIVPVQTGTRTG